MVRYFNPRINDGLNVPRATSATGPFMVRLKSGATSMFSAPPGIFTVTGLLTNPRRTAALAAAQEDEPEACVSPAPRSQIRMKTSLRPVGTTSCTFVRLGNSLCCSRAGPSAKSSFRDQDSPVGLKTTQWGLPTLTPVKSSGLRFDQLLINSGTSVSRGAHPANVAIPISTVAAAQSQCRSI